LIGRCGVYYFIWCWGRKYFTCSSDTDELLALALEGRDGIDESLGRPPLLIYLSFQIGFRGEMYNVVQGPVIDIVLVPPNHHKLRLLQPIFKQK